jgi:hypothetical protein
MKHLTFIVLALFLASYSSTAQNHKLGTVKKRSVKVRFPPPIIFECDPYFVPIDSISKHIYDEVTTEGKVYDYKVLKNKSLLYLGAPYPNQLLIVILKGHDVKNLYRGLNNATVRVTGKIFTENDKTNSKPVMYVTFPTYIEVAKQSAPNSN